MLRGDKSKYTDRQDRKAESSEDRDVSEKEAKQRASNQHSMRNQTEE